MITHGSRKLLPRYRADTRHRQFRKSTARADRMSTPGPVPLHAVRAALAGGKFVGCLRRHRSSFPAHESARPTGPHRQGIRKPRTAPAARTARRSSPPAADGDAPRGLSVDIVGNKEFHIQPIAKDMAGTLRDRRADGVPAAGLEYTAPAQAVAFGRACDGLPRLLSAADTPGAQPFAHRR